MMDAGGREKLRVWIWVEKGALFRQSWISGLAAAHCSACFHTKHSALAPNQLQSGQWTHPLTLFLFFSLTFWLTPVFPLFIFIFYSLPPSFGSLFPSFLTFIFSFSTPIGPFLQPSGSTEGCGFGPGPPGFHSDTLCPDVISIDDVQLGQAVLAEGVFTVYHKLRPFTERCVCVWHHVCLFYIQTGAAMNE